jgi:hypothetical protein
MAGERNRSRSIVDRLLDEVQEQLDGHRLSGTVGAEQLNTSPGAIMRFKLSRATCAPYFWSDRLLRALTLRCVIKGGGRGVRRPKSNHWLPAAGEWSCNAEPADTVEAVGGQ